MYQKKILIIFTVFIFIIAKAFAVTVPNASVSTFSPEQRSTRTESIWLKPYSAFETIELESGNRVHNTAYGTYIGYDTNVINLGNDWDSVLTFHTGYTGSRQKYNARTIFQNGGQLGVSGVFFRKNFFLGILTNVGATNAISESSFENINFSMLSATAALKTGYNFEFLEKRLSFQPSFLGAYLWINTFDYVNAQNEIVKSDPVYSIQLVPGLKLTANLEDGWQPYIGVQQVWNIINASRFSPNDVSIGEISLKPYVQYGIGLQKNVGEDFTGYIQSTVRNGGRNGIILSFGLRKYF